MLDWLKRRVGEWKRCRPSLRRWAGSTKPRKVHCECGSIAKCGESIRRTASRTPGACGGFECAPTIFSPITIAMGASSDFRKSILNINDDLMIQLRQTASGHLMLPGSRWSQGKSLNRTNLSGGVVYSASMGDPASEMSPIQLKKVRNQLGH